MQIYTDAIILSLASKDAFASAQKAIQAGKSGEPHATDCNTMNARLYGTCVQTLHQLQSR